jgi:hypothetical protein
VIDDDEEEVRAIATATRSPQLYPRRGRRRMGFETNARQLTPKHGGRLATIRDQRTRPLNNIDNFAKSAKPPSPVQIRAAPPIFS